MSALTVATDRADTLADARPGGPSRVRSAGPAAADRSGAGARADRTMRSWPLLVLVVPAGAEVWSGWVGIAQKTGTIAFTVTATDMGQFQGPPARCGQTREPDATQSPAAPYRRPG
jgi:hypothetical protein